MLCGFSVDHNQEVFKTSRVARGVARAGLWLAGAWRQTTKHPTPTDRHVDLTMLAESRAPSCWSRCSQRDDARRQRGVHPVHVPRPRTFHVAGSTYHDDDRWNARTAHLTRHMQRISSDIVMATADQLIAAINITKRPEQPTKGAHGRTHKPGPRT